MGEWLGSVRDKNFPSDNSFRTLPLIALIIAADRHIQACLVLWEDSVTAHMDSTELLVESPIPHSDQLKLVSIYSHSVKYMLCEVSVDIYSVWSQNPN